MRINRHLVRFTALSAGCNIVTRNYIRARACILTNNDAAQYFKANFLYLCGCGLSQAQTSYRSSFSFHNDTYDTREMYYHLFTMTNSCYFIENNSTHFASADVYLIAYQ